MSKTRLMPLRRTAKSVRQREEARSLAARVDLERTLMTVRHQIR